MAEWFATVRQKAIQLILRTPTLYHRKTRQVTDSDICRDTTLELSILISSMVFSTVIRRWRSGSQISAGRHIVVR